MMTSRYAETNVPNFLLKLWNLVEDSKFRQFIEWDESGFIFRIHEPYEFSRQILPTFFKHNNLNSFIRQLNMYGFRKVGNLEKGSIKNPTDASDTLEFQHPYFIKDHPELLEYIRRKPSASSSKIISGKNPMNNVLEEPTVSSVKQEAEQPVFPKVIIDGREYLIASAPNAQLMALTAPPPENVSRPSTPQSAAECQTMKQVLDEVRKMRHKQSGMDQKFKEMKSENEALWREVVMMRHKHLAQQEIVDRLMKFLIAFANQRAHNSTNAANCDGNENRLIKRTLLAIDSPNSLKRVKLDETGPNPTESVRMMAKLEQQLCQPSSLPCSPKVSAQNDPKTAEDLNRRKSVGAQYLSGNPQQHFSSGSNQSNFTNQYPVQNFILNQSGMQSTPTIDDVTHELGHCTSNVNNNNNDVMMGNVCASQQPIHFGATNSPLPLIDMIDSPCCNQLQYSISNIDPTLSSSLDPPLDAFAFPPGEASPSIANHLNFTQRELDDLKSVLASTEYNLDTKDLDDLFGTGINEHQNIINSTNMYPNVSNQQIDYSLPKLDNNEILGNEVQLYKPPYNFLDNTPEKNVNFTTYDNNVMKSNRQSCNDLNTPTSSAQFIIGNMENNKTPDFTVFMPNSNTNEIEAKMGNVAPEITAEQKILPAQKVDNIKVVKHFPQIAIVNKDGKTQRIIVIKRK